MEREIPTRWPDLGPRRQRLRLQGFDYSDPNRIFFVTVCARHLATPFLDSSLAGAVTDAIRYRADHGEWRVYAYCLMPDHLHLALSPIPGNGDISHLLQGFKSYTTRLAWKHGRQGVLWQRSYYDHVARREEDVPAICQYILENPVRKGLVTDAAAWPYSGMLHVMRG